MKARDELAFLVAPAVPILGFSAYFFATGVPVDEVFWTLVLPLILSYIHALFLGVPVIAILRKLKKLTRSSVVCSAFLIGASSVVYDVISRYVENSPRTSHIDGDAPHWVDSQLAQNGVFTDIALLLTFGGAGAVAGLAWWYVSGSSCEQPDQEVAQC